MAVHTDRSGDWELESEDVSTWCPTLFQSGHCLYLTIPASIAEAKGGLWSGRSRSLGSSSAPPCYTANTPLYSDWYRRMHIEWEYASRLWENGHCQSKLTLQGFVAYTAAEDKYSRAAHLTPRSFKIHTHRGLSLREDICFLFRFKYLELVRSWWLCYFNRDGNKHLTLPSQASSTRGHWGRYQWNILRLWLIFFKAPPHHSPWSFQWPRGGWIGQVLLPLL